MICRDVLCHEGRDLDNGACLTNTKIVTNSTCFSAFIKMSPRTNLLSDDNGDDVRMITIHIGRSLAEKLWICYAMEEEFVFFTNADAKRQIKYFVVFIVVYIPINVTGCESDVYIDKLLSLYSDNITVKDSIHGSFSFGLEAAVFNVTHTWNRAYLFVPNMFDSTITVLETLLYWEIKRPCDLTELTPINKLFYCPFVVLGADEIFITVENEFLFFVNVETPNQTLKTLSRWEYEIHGDQISICLEDFIELYSIMIESKSVLSVHLSPQMAGNLKHSLALACVSLSIVCLFVTIVIYLSNSSLHSQPGINNVILCIFLLLAQTVYQFGAGQTYLPNSACSLIGATCHFLWLSVMFSMNICCIQMFTIFKNPTNSSRMLDSWRTFKHVLYVICSSALFVFINMVISLVETDGVSIGYGGKLCYLSSNLMQAITFVAPSAMTLVVNIFIFAYVVYSIQKVSSAKLLQKERNYLGVYARLSTLTGLTWIFGFCRLVFETEILEYLFIIFNAGQGVFMMIAFVLNRRVLSLFCSNSCVTSS